MKIINRISDMGKCLLLSGGCVGMGIASLVHAEPTEFRIPMSIVVLGLGVLFFGLACLHMIELSDLKVLHSKEDEFEKRSSKTEQ